jgi:hypothetical protein
MRRSFLAGALAAAALGTACSGGAAPPYRGAAPAGAPPPDLPARVSLKTPTEAFTHEWYVALRAGRIWVRPNVETTGRDEPWRPLPPDGFAHHALRPEAGAPPVLVELSADGDNLVALGDDGLVYYMKFHDTGWIDDWGIPPTGDPLWVGFPHRALAISHRGPVVGGYEDTDGNFHPISAGVTTLYALSGDGRAITFADPWLPAHFGRRICLPEGDRFVAAAMGASASTLFVVDAAGAIYTRLADYDTLGENPVLGYTYVRGKHDDRTLPPEDWRPQPPVPGKMTRAITILQTGPGNASREVRVEGVDATGAGGYWRKALLDAAWSFVRTGAEVRGPFLANAASGAPPPPPAELRSPSRARDLAGTIERPAGAAGTAVALLGFLADCPPATLRLSAGGATLDVPLHLRSPDRAADGTVLGADGTLLVPRAAAPPPALAPLVEQLFGKDAIVTVDVRVEGAEVLLKGDAPGLGRRLRLRFR